MGWVLGGVGPGGSDCGAHLWKMAESFGIDRTETDPKQPENGRHQPVLWRLTAVNKGARRGLDEGAMGNAWTLKAAACAISVLGMAASVGGCASSNESAALESRPGLACIDDSKQCIDQRQGVLRTMMADRDRKWVREPASPQAYASGVRLFAYKGRKKEMSCDELAHGKREADAAPTVLKGPGASSLTPAQVSRGTMLAAEVSRELGVEMKRRCRA